MANSTPRGIGKCGTDVSAAACARPSGAGVALAPIVAAPTGIQASLQTSMWAFLRPAVALQRCHGFTECLPFAEGAEDPNSVFPSLGLGAP